MAKLYRKRKTKWGGIRKGRRNGIVDVSPDRRFDSDYGMPYLKEFRSPWSDPKAEVKPHIKTLRDLYKMIGR
jgi:hypothetical protein